MDKSSDSGYPRRRARASERCSARKTPKGAKVCSPGLAPSLFYTSCGPARASGPKSFQDRAKSCIRCSPIQVVCGPGGSLRFLLT